MVDWWWICTERPQVEVDSKEKQITTNEVFFQSTCDQFMEQLRRPDRLPLFNLARN